MFSTRWGSMEDNLLGNINFCVDNHSMFYADTTNPWFTFFRDTSSFMKIHLLYKHLLRQFLCNHGRNWILYLHIKFSIHFCSNFLFVWDTINFNFLLSAALFSSITVPHFFATKNTKMQHVITFKSLPLDSLQWFCSWGYQCIGKLASVR